MRDDPVRLLRAAEYVGVIVLASPSTSATIGFGRDSFGPDLNPFEPETEAAALRRRLLRPPVGHRWVQLAPAGSPCLLAPFSPTVVRIKNALFINSYGNL
jgi:hypothetical protein